MNAEQLKKEILSLVSHILFTYKGKDCGIDPLSVYDIDIWCGDSYKKCRSIDEVMNTPIFEGKPLKDICETVEFI